MNVAALVKLPEADSAGMKGIIGNFDVADCAEFFRLRNLIRWNAKGNIDFVVVVVVV